MGSKGLPKKNLMRIDGRSLIEIAIDCAVNTSEIKKVIVSSDSPDALMQAVNRGAKAHKRSTENASDSSLMSEVVGEVLSSNLLDFQPDDLIVLLQPTSPLRTSSMILEARDLLESCNASAVYSVKPIDKRLLKAWTRFENEQVITPVNKEAYPFSNRQELPETVICDGLIFLFRVDAFMKLNDFPTSNVVPIMFQEQYSLDIDNENDLEIARKNSGLIEKRVIHVS